MKRDSTEADLTRDLRARLHALPREVAPPPGLWGDIVARLADARPAPATAPAVPSRAWGFRRTAARVPFGAPASRWGVRPALAAALVLCLAGTLWLRHGGGAWRVTQASGAYTLSDGLLATAASTRARLDVGRLGEVEVAPRTRLRLLATRPDHRLALDRGSIAARISAPPRLFYVETPSGTAVDLGCAYTLAVDPRGGSLIHVTVGWVELDGRGASSVVPFNMSAYTRRGFRPGTPFLDRASDSLKAALDRFDFEGGGDAAVAAVLRASTANDAITLWHLLGRTTGAVRLAVYRRLAAIAAPPAGVSEASVLALNHRALTAWWDVLPGSPGTLPWWQRAAVRLGAWLGVF